MKNFFKKTKLWIKETGLTNLFYIAIAIGIWIIPLGPLVGIKSEVCVGALSIFAYINWNIVKKLWKAKVGDKIDNVIDRIEDKL